MIKTICDICGRETATEKHDISYKSVYGGYSSQKIDMCRECDRELRSLNLIIEDAFQRNKGDRTKTLQYLYDEYVGDENDE